MSTTTLPRDGAFRSYNLSRPRVESIDAVDGAAWQKGVTPESWRSRVLLDGRPVLMAVAASDAGGWVDVEVCRVLGVSGVVVRGTERRRGRVEIVPAAADNRPWRF